MARIVSTPVAIEGIREELKCAICHELCTVPKSLECMHTFCEECLQKWLDTMRKANEDTSFLRNFQCPECCQPTDLSGGLSSLRTNFRLDAVIRNLRMLDLSQQVNCEQCVDEGSLAVSYCNTCERHLCAFHVDCHRMSRDYVDHSLVTLQEAGAQSSEKTKTPVLKSLHVCTKHNEEFRWFCITCEKPICSACTMKDHRDHSFEWINEEMAQNEREFIRESLLPVEEVIPAVTHCCTELENCQSCLMTSKKALEEEIESVTRQRKMEVDEERTLLQSRVDDIFLSMKKSLDHQLKEAKQLKENIELFLEDMRTTIEKATDVDLLVSRNELLARSESLQQMCSDSDLSVPIGGGNLHSQYVLTSSSPVPLASIREKVKSFKCELKKSVAKQGTEVSVKVTTYGTLNQPLKSGGANCEAFLKHDNAAGTPAIPCHVSDNDDGSFTVRCTPTEYGRRKIHVQFPSDCTQQSSVDVNIIRSYEPLLANPVAINLQCSPWGVALLRDNRLAVSTSEKDVRIFDINTHQRVDTIHSNFVRPYAMTEDREGNLWVTDREAHNIQKFSKDGGGWTKVLQYGSKGRENGRFAHPRGIAIHPNSGLIYIADMKNYRIQVFHDDQQQRTLRQVNSFGSHGTENGQFDQPASLIFNKRGQLVVCDDRNGRLQLFTHEGSHIDSLGVSQAGRGLLCSPIGVAIDSHDRYIVGEFGCHAVSFLTPKGKILSCVRSAGGEVGEFEHPRGVAVDTSGRIYVADFQHERVVIL